MFFIKRNVVGSEDADLENYLKHLKKYDTLTEKVKQLCQLSCLTPEDLKIRQAIVRNVYNSLNIYYKDCQVFTFGSSNNGFGTRGSDLDLLFLPSPEYCKSGEEQDNGEETVPNLYQVNTGEVSFKHLTHLSEKSQLLFVRRVLRKAHFFKRIVFIPAKCPILNFIAKANRSLISCDLSCRNRLVVCNTDLLRFFASIDQRVKPLVITLRFWAKALGIIHTQALSSYAFTLLVIFFLQNTNPPILPSVNSLMEMSSSSTEVAGWEVSFIQDLKKVPKTKNKNTEGELLQTFFSFFWNFDFVRNIVCIRTGRELSIEELKKLHFERFEISALCIQDPFDLSHNVGKNMKHDSCNYFKSSLLIANDILKVEADCKMDADRFTSLFDLEALKHKIENIFHIKDCNSTEFIVTLNHEIISSLGDGECLLKNWYAKASEAILELLKYGLLIECEVIDKVGFVLDKYVEHQADIHQYKNCILTIQCALYDRVWVNRNSTLILPDTIDTEKFSNGVLQTEYNLSKSVISSNPSLSCKEPILWFLCRCYKTDFLQIPHIFVVLSPLKKCKEYNQVCKFLSSFIQKMVTQMLIRPS